MQVHRPKIYIYFFFVISVLSEGITIYIYVQYLAEMNTALMLYIFISSCMRICILHISNTEIQKTTNK